MHNRINSTDKANNFVSSIKKLMKYINKYLPFIIIAIILSTVSSIFTIIGPDKIGDITNIIAKGVRTGIDLDEIKDISIFLLIIYGLSLLFGYLQGLIMSKVTQEVSFSLRKSISSKINKLPLKYFDNTTVGDVLSRITNDVDTIGQSLNQSLGTFVSSLTLFVGSFIMMFMENKLMTLTAVLATIIGFGLMFVIMKNSQKYFKKLQDSLGSINGHIEEMYTGSLIVKAYNEEENSIKDFEKINDELYKNVKLSRFFSGLMQPLMSFIGNFGYVAVCVVGSILVMDGKIEFGVIVSFMIYIRLFTRPLAQFAQVASLLQSTAAASERVFELLDEEELSKEENCLGVKPKGNISFKNVKFGYSSDKIIINDFSLDVKKGEKIAIVGPTGAGKTTLVNLLMKFYDIDSGSIVIDGVDFKNIKRSDIHNMFCMVLQDTWTFSGTLRENLVYNNLNVCDEEINNVCRVVGLDHYINTLSNGIDSKIDESSISTGEKQLLTIARGLLEKAPFLILDEATSSVDTRTEVIVAQAMDKLSEGKTSFIIAHRLSTIKNADKILVLNEGDIVEQGTHDELISKKGFYNELYQAQFEE